MKLSNRQPRKIGHNRALHAALFVLAMLSFALNSTTLRAASVRPSDYRIANAGDNFDGTRQYAVAFRFRPPRRIRARRLELAMNTSHGRNTMQQTTDLDEFTATDIRIALNEIYPESAYGAVPVLDQYDALEAYRAFDDGGFAEAPEALVAYITRQQLRLV